MDILIDFLINNYIWFLVITLIIIFALIGYLVDINNPNKVKKNEKINPIAPVAQEDVQVHPSVEIYTNDTFDEPLINDND